MRGMKRFHDNAVDLKDLKTYFHNNGKAFKNIVICLDFF